MLRLNAVTKTFPGRRGPVPALSAIDLEIAPASFVALLGPSGCGKSTLLRLIAGLDAPTSGTITRSAPGDAGAELAYVFQDAHLLPWRTVGDNAALPLELRGVARDERRRVAAEALATLGLRDAIDRYPAELSGGMRMRVSLARALVTRPRILLLDEPFAALDEVIRHRLGEQLRSLWQTGAMTVVFVTHAISEAVYLAERVVLFSARPGRIIADRMIDLPRERAPALRTEPAFAREVRGWAEIFPAEQGLDEKVSEAP